MFLKKGFKIKILALALAIALKLFIHGSSELVPVTIPLSLEIKNLPPTMMVVGPQNWERGVVASLDLKGPKILADQVKNYPNKVVVDYPDDEPMELRVELLADQFWIPPGVEILNINPTFIDLYFDKVVVKELPVTPQFDGRVAQGFKIGKIVANPQRVLVRGPKKELDKMNKISSEVINIDELEETKIYSVLILNRSKNISIPNNQVTVQVQLERE